MGGANAVDDEWGGVEAVIRLDGTRFGPDAVRGSTRSRTWSSSSSSTWSTSRRSRPAPAAPREPGLARGGHVRPAGQDAAQPARGLACRCSRVDGLDLHVRGLDAVDGTPVLDVKPYMREFEPAAADVRQPAWATELMAGYYEPKT